MTSREQYARFLNGRLPAWTHDLSNRTKVALRNEQIDCHFELTPDAVKARDYIEWMRVPGMGRKAVEELLDYVWHIAPTPMWPARSRP